MDDDERAGGEVSSSSSSGEPSPAGDAPSHRGGSPRGPLIAGIVVAVVVLAAIAASAAIRADAPDLPERFEPTDVVPYAISYPEAWTAADPGSGVVVITPIEGIAELAPEALEQLLIDDPQQVVVLQLFGVVPSEQLAQIGEGGPLTVDADEDVDIDGRDGRRITLSGRVFESTPGEGPDTEGTIVVWVADLGGGRSVAFFILSSDAAEDPRLFDAIADSVDLDTPQMERALAQPLQPSGAPSPQPSPAPTGGPTPSASPAG
jgi:hypothetical protein